jgi:hypothetical protein
MKVRLFAELGAFALSAPLAAAPVLAPPRPLAPAVQAFVSVPAGRIALTHVRVIDGTGAAPLQDATILIDGAKIEALQTASAAVPVSYRTIDLSGASVIPGIVGMHNHMFYIARPNVDARPGIPRPRCWCRK